MTPDQLAARAVARPPPPLDGLSAEDWLALVEAGFRGGVLAALAPRLPPAPEVRARFARLAAAQRLEAAARQSSLAEVLGLLAARGLRAAPLKGPALAERLYPDPALRPSGDLDVLVAPADLEAAVAALGAGGFVLQRGPLERHARRHGHHLALSAPGLAPLELHFRPLSAFSSDLPAAELLGRARPRRLASGAEVLVLAPEDELVVLAVHAVEHQARRPGWILDLLLLLDATPALDWGAVEERAGRWRCRRALAHTLLLLRTFGAEVPARLAAPAGDARTRLAERLRLAILARPRGPARTVLQLAFEGLLTDRAAAAARSAAVQVGWAVGRRVRRFTPLRPREPT
jgi:hypothetical protein